MFLEELKRLGKSLSDATAKTNAIIYYLESIELEEDLEQRKRCYGAAARLLEQVTELNINIPSLMKKSGDYWIKADNLPMGWRAYHTAFTYKPADPELIEKLMQSEIDMKPQPEKTYQLHVRRAQIGSRYRVKSLDHLYNKAISEIELYLGIDPEDIDAWITLGRLYEDRGLQTLQHSKYGCPSPRGLLSVPASFFYSTIVSKPHLLKGNVV